MIRYSNSRNWQLTNYNKHNIFYYGNLEIVKKILNKIIKENFIDYEYFHNLIKDYDYSFFGFMTIYKDKIYACTDHCRSKPIFYTLEKNICISNDSNLIREEKKNKCR